MTLLRLRNPPIGVIDTHRTIDGRCWYCSGHLPPSFTSVEKNGRHLRVHFGCRAGAQEQVAKSRSYYEVPF